MFLHREFPLEEPKATCQQVSEDCACEVTQVIKQIEDIDEIGADCPICTLPVDLCVCPPCPVCGIQGLRSCYIDHNLRYTKQQVVSFLSTRIEETDDEILFLMAERTELVEQLEEVMELPDDYVSDYLDPTGGIVSC